MPWHSDLTLSRRLERAEATANARFVEARTLVFPGCGAGWIEVAGAYAMFDGLDSPCTQTFGLGLFEMPLPEDMERIEAFFEERGAAVFHEVSPLADRRILPLMRERGYSPVELSNILCLPLEKRAPPAPVQSVQVRLVGAEESELWARTAAEGWREYTDVSELLPGIMRVMCARRDNLTFLAEVEGHPVAAGSLAIHDGVALLAGASTVPEWRRRGAQAALLEARLSHARQSGCDVAMIGAEPGGATQRNVERLGFRVAYTRIKWGREPT
ncbi:MAG: GNAT family N-acetyltransferase [Bryobacterales bacterium]|nr:GNAT family N-acetyltransferase [Bryobacterales bacterium]